ncbi:MAG: hypothetical protein K0M50_17570 [Prolixibacteraceae bacterium]|nr:hypothetical protein [Prolixibacteraceae bacterium]
MNKIIFHKNCIQHEAVAKVKRMLNKIKKDFGGFQGIFYCSIQLTGVNDIDRKEIKSHIEKHLRNLKKKIDKQLLQNETFVSGEINEDYEEGFYIPPFTEELNLIESLNKVSSYIQNNYPEIKTKQSEFIFTKNTSEEKFNEAKLHFQNNPIIGFSQEYFAVLENGENKKLYPFTFSSYDLIDAKSIRCVFL